MREDHQTHFYRAETCVAQMDGSGRMCVLYSSNALFLLLRPRRELTLEDWRNLVRPPLKSKKRQQFSKNGKWDVG